MGIIWETEGEAEESTERVIPVLFKCKNKNKRKIKEDDFRFSFLLISLFDFSFLPRLKKGKHKRDERNQNLAVI